MAGGDGNPVLLVHGILDTHYTPWWGVLEDHLVSAGVPRETIHRMDYHAVPGQKVNSVEGYAEKVATEVDWLRDFHDSDVDLVGHSMGGLDCRWYIEVLDGHEHVDRLVTLSTPHRGSLLSGLTRLLPAGREMWPSSDLLGQLNEARYPGNVAYRAVWSTGDPVMWPKSSGKLPHRHRMKNAENVAAGCYGHVEMVWRRPVFNKYRHFLVDGPADGMEDETASERSGVTAPEEAPYKVPTGSAVPAQDRGVVGAVASVLPWR